MLEQVNHFGSLPLRKSRGKPVQRSVSDASTKKSRKPSILNLFNTSINSNGNNSNSKSSKRVERSKSDASRNKRRGSNDSNSSTGSKTKREKFKFRLGKTNTNLTNNSLTNSSDSDNHLAVTQPKKIQLSPITEINNRSDYFEEFSDSTKPISLEKAKDKESKFVGNIGFTSHEDLDLVPTTDTQKLKSTASSFAKSKSMDEMHSSQLPPEKPLLTKGVAVDNMIKRLSSEHVSPPAQILTLGGFSYTNPSGLASSSPPSAAINALTPTKQKSLSPLNTTNLNNNLIDSGNDIVYAQVVRNETKNSNGNKIVYKETVHNAIKHNYRSTSPPNTNQDTVDFVTANPSNGYNSQNNFHSKSNFINHKSFNEIDEGIDHDLKYQKFNGNEQFEESHLNEEPIITPKIRHRGPNKYSTTSTTIITSNNHNNYTNNQNQYKDYNQFDARDMDVNDLSYRREILESRIRSRIGGLHKGYNTIERHQRHRTVSPPPVSGRYHRYETNETITTRYSPERNHIEIVSPPVVNDEVTYNDHSEPPNKYKDYVDSTLRRSTHYYSKNEKVDSGIENDFRRNSYEKKPRKHSRFDIG